MSPWIKVPEPALVFVEKKDAEGVHANQRGAQLLARILEAFFISSA